MLAKFLFVKNKRGSIEDDPIIWIEAREQLEDYMLGSRNVHPLYSPQKPYNYDWLTPHIKYTILLPQPLYIDHERTEEN